MADPISESAQGALFFDARTFHTWQTRPVDNAVLKAIYDMAKWAPTSVNCSPLRLVFVKSPAQKEKLRPFMDKGNVDKTMLAPVTAIIAYDNEFYNHLPRLVPHVDAKSWFTGNPVLADETAWRNGTLQGAYLMMAARAAGLDCGPMSGFDKAGVKKAFFGDKNVTVNFLCNLGYGDPSGLYPRAPRLDFDEVCQIL
jgi:3-hydroxypropanoate dehydrogenase